MGNWKNFDSSWVVEQGKYRIKRKTGKITIRISRNATRNHSINNFSKNTIILAIQFTNIHI